ncbi:universal stress protein [Marinobacter sp. M216]|uniref:Universal stress protein n=1 Tax=Marinobacter albus TaxID=3030833 RepID=A0ABT7H9B8_9GAMM|nr:MULTISPECIES: universal stress protein [unclassified Marinobacter]MBW7470801.1 universal stress protein [Marinobacter sp. F4218]MDK9556929.1 universal stress protein [Marinobacter sp. M216]
MDKDSPSIVVACDESVHSLNAAKMAAELADAMGHPLKLLTVYPASKESVLVISGVEHSEIEAGKHDYSRKVFDAAKDAIRGRTDAAEEVLLSGDPAHEILEYMNAHPGTHLVLGRRGHSLVRSLTLGSVSEKIVRHAHGAVTVVGA